MRVQRQIQLAFGEDSLRASGDGFAFTGAAALLQKREKPPRSITENAPRTCLSLEMRDQGGVRRCQVNHYAKGEID